MRYDIKEHIPIVDVQLRKSLIRVIKFRISRQNVIYQVIRVLSITKVQQI